MNEPEVIWDFDPYGLPNNILMAVGRVAMCAAQSERIVGMFIASTLRMDIVETVALTTHMSNPLKDQVARALVELNAPSTNAVDKVDDLLDAIRQAQAKRNLIVHNSMAVHPETGEVYSFRESARGSTQVKLQKISVEDLNAIAEEINDTALALMTYMSQADLSPINRTRPVKSPFNRGVKARKDRRQRVLSQDPKRLF